MGASKLGYRQVAHFKRTGVPPLPCGGWCRAGGVAAHRFASCAVDSADWQQAAWLRGATQNQLRYEFVLPEGQVAWGRAYVAAPGCHSLQVNGETPQPDLRGICPWVVKGSTESEYGGNTRYQTHNVTSLLNPGGKNAVGLLVGQVMDTTNSIVAIIMVQMAGSEGQPLLFTTGDKGWIGRSSFVTKGTLCRNAKQAVYHWARGCL